MEHKVIDQTQLVHDIISLESDMEITSPTNEAECENDVGYNVLLYKWHLVNQTTGNESLVIKLAGQTWEGVRAA
jgi:hypothetical protein